MLEKNKQKKHFICSYGPLTTLPYLSYNLNESIVVSMDCWLSGKLWGPQNEASELGLHCLFRSVCPILKINILFCFFSLETIEVFLDAFFNMNTIMLVLNEIIMIMYDIIEFCLSL